MKTIVKLVLGTAVLAAGVGAANAAVPLPSTGSSDLLFFVADTNTSTSYTEVLSQTVGTTGPGSVFNSSDALNNASGASQGASVATITGKTDFSVAANANMESFISTAETAHENLVWGVYAGAQTGSTTTVRKVAGNSLGLTTSTDAASVVQANQNLLITSTLSQGLTSDIRLLNAALDSSSPNAGGLNALVSSQSVGKTADYYGSGIDAGVVIGGSAHLYGLAGNGQTSGALLGYDLGSITFDGTTLSFTGNSGGTTPTVPLPAAAWLFGSGLLGLLGIGRRRNVAVAA